VCPHTGDRQLAETWFAEYAVAGVEGLVVKGAAMPYRPGGAGWVKVRARDTADYVIGGVTGSLARPPVCCWAATTGAGCSASPTLGYCIQMHAPTLRATL
jgi:hypothetical protein